MDEYITCKKVKDNFHAFLIEGAELTSVEGYPLLEKWMVPSEPPKKIIPFNKIKGIKDIENYYICTYCRDEDFMKIYRNPKQYLKLFSKAAGLIGFDLSVHEDMPPVKQKEQMNHNLELSFYYGIRNIKLIPNIRPGSDSVNFEYYKAFPKGTMVSIGTYGFFKSKEEKLNHKKCIEEIVDVLKPSGIIVYGSFDDNVFEKCINNNIPLYIYRSETSEKLEAYKR